MNQLTKMFDGQNLTIIESEDGPRFLLKDVCNILELGHVPTVTRRLEDDVVSKHTIQDSLGRGQQATFVNEDGLYDVILDSRKPEAKRFRKWITSEVLPSIRKTGSYSIDTAQLSPELQMMNQMFQAVAKNELETKEVKQLAIDTKKEVNNISNLVTMTSDDWRGKVKTILNKIAMKWTGVEPYRSVRNLSYERLEKRARCNLDIRLNNRKERALAQGMTKSYIKKINKLDCIAEEKRLTEIYIQVVKEMAIQHKINVNNFQSEEVI